ncbi:unnamed protein product [Peronospora belbahrii]|uniref:Ubiquitin-like domain-containing protein n=1 Tax=Peronospora belbahrii TaxID=622444 RepID=A0AAU9KHU6_9STRA|nr:unnamed protein product [Peronospora belbahrii]CAH0517636.1 unnamed protein product [Peronospora belbahrii]
MRVGQHPGDQQYSALSGARHVGQQSVAGKRPTANALAFTALSTTAHLWINELHGECIRKQETTWQKRSNRLAHFSVDTSILVCFGECSTVSTCERSTAFHLIRSDVGETGLKGVIDVHLSDLQTNSRVRDLIAIVETKLQALPQQRDCIRTVKVIYLHGSRISNNQFVVSLIPDLESSAPRLLVAVQARSNCTKDKALMVHVKSCETGELVSIVCTPEDTVDDVKTRIQAEWQIPACKQRIIFAGKTA